MQKADLVLALSRKPTLDEFLGGLGIGSKRLGAQILEDVYRAFFIQSTDLKSEYQQYYAIEYPTLKDYLEIAHEIYLENDDLEKHCILKVDRLWGVVDPAYNENLLDAVIECIKKLDSSHEN